MQFDSIADLFWMEGHGPYVWAAYGITFLAIFGLIFSIFMARKNFFATQRSIAKRASAEQNDSGLKNQEN